MWPSGFWILAAGCGAVLHVLFCLVVLLLYLMAPSNSVTTFLEKKKLVALLFVGLCLVYCLPRCCLCALPTTFLMCSCLMNLTLT